MNSSNRKRIGKLIYYSQLYWLLIDSITGLTIRSYSVSFGLIFRFLVMSLLLLYPLLYFKKGAKYLYGFVTVLLLWSTLHMVIFDNFSSFKIIFKLLLIPLFLIVIPLQIKEGIIDELKARKIIIFNSIILFINISLSFVGIGYSSYGNTGEANSFGGIGFFYAGNEVGATLLIITALLFSLFYYRKVQLVILSLLVIVMAIGISSKTAIFGVLFLVMATFIKKNFLNGLGFLIIGFLAYFKYSNIMNEVLSGFLTRLTYFGDLYGYDVLILGGEKRVAEIRNYLNLIYNNPFHLIIGSGWSGITENNFFDLLSAFGLVGLAFFGFIIFPAKKLFTFYRTYGAKNLFPILVSIFVIMVTSIIAGHVLQSAMVALFMALALNFQFLFHQKDLHS